MRPLASRTWVAVACGSVVALLLSGSAMAETVAVYKVQPGGSLTQSFNYKAHSRTNTGCWIYDYDSTGMGTFDLKPTATGEWRGKEHVIEVVDRGGNRYGFHGLRWRGSMTRNTSIQMATRNGPNAGDPFCEKKKDPPDTVGCGSAQATPDDVPLMLQFHNSIPVISRQIKASPTDEVGLFGGMPDSLELYPCPSESAYSVLINAGHAFTSDVAVKKLATGKPTVNLAAHDSVTETHNGFTAFAGTSSGDGVQNAKARWNMTLTCVAKCSR